MRPSKTLILTVLLALTSPVFPAPAHWPQFRGPGSAGTSEDARLPVSWSTTENVAWSVAIPGRSWSSPVVWGKKVFVATVVNEGADHDPKKGLYFGGNRPKPIPHLHRWQVICLDFDSGKPLWTKVVHEAKPTTGIHIKNTYASETPVTDGERLYAYFGNVGLFVLDLAGKKLWEKRWEVVPTRYDWGSAGSPVLHDDKLLIVNDNEKRSFIIALDKRTGDVLWKTPRDEKSNWSTPFVWQTDERVEVVTPGSQKVRSYGVTDGKLLWELTGMSTITIATPYAKHGLLYVSSGYVGDQSRPLYAIRPGAQGDITLEDGKQESESIAWSWPQAAPYNPSTLVYGDYLYTLHDRGFFLCYDAKTGKEIYGKKRLGRGNAFTSSPWAYRGKIFCLSEDGDTFVVSAAPEFKIEATNSLDEMCMATPALAGGSLFIRTLTKLYCIKEP